MSLLLGMQVLDPDDDRDKDLSDPRIKAGVIIDSGSPPPTNPSKPSTTR